MATAHHRLLDVLGHAQQQGFLGPGDPREHVEHALAHDAAAHPQPGERWCDLGSGGGVPGLVLALRHPDVRFVLLERSQRRSEFLRIAVRDLSLSGRTEIAFADAADLARQQQHRSSYDGVVSRGFGPPAVVAECSSGLLRLGGRLVVSEPPASNQTRWPAEGLARLGMGFVRIIEGPPVFAELERVAAGDARHPRTWKQMRKRPLF